METARRILSSIASDDGSSFQDAITVATDSNTSGHESTIQFWVVVITTKDLVAPTGGRRTLPRGPTNWGNIAATESGVGTGSAQTFQMYLQVTARRPTVPGTLHRYDHCHRDVYRPGHRHKYLYHYRNSSMRDDPRSRRSSQRNVGYLTQANTRSCAGPASSRDA